MPPPYGFEVGGGYYGSFGAPPVYGTVPPPRTPGFNLGQPSGPLEGALQSLLPMFAELLRNQVGGSVFTFGSDMNALSAKMSQQFVQQINQARAIGSELDRPQVNQLLTGIARALGNNVNDPTVQGAIGRLSGDVTNMLPVLAAVFPDYVDRWLPRGSMTVASASFVSAGRFVTDPATGLPVSTDPGYGTRVVSDLLAQGPKATYGLGAGRIGQLYEQLVARGLINSGTDLREQVELGDTFRTLGMGDLGIGMTGDKARGIQADRVKAQLKDYSRALSAINDIFADAGRPNTPIGELFAAMERLSAGGLSGMTKETLAHTLRMSQAVASMTGMGVDAQGALTGQIAAGLQQGGRPASLAPYLSQYTALMGRTYANAGLVFGGPEGQSIDEVVGRRARLGVAGLTSDATRSVGTVLALAESAPAGSPLSQLADAIKARQTSVTIGGRTYDTLRLNPEDVNQLAAASGLGDGAFQRQMMATPQVNAALARNSEVATWATNVLQEGEARQLIGGWIRMGSPSLTDDQAAKAYDALQARIARGGFESDDQLVALVGKDMGLNTEQMLQLKTSIGRFGGWRVMADVNPELRRRADREARIAGGRATAFERATHLLRGPWSRLLAQTLVDYGGGADNTALGWVLRAMGLVSNQEMEEAAAGAAGGDRDILKDVMGLIGQFGPITPELLKATQNMDPDNIKKTLTARDLSVSMALTALTGGATKSAGAWSSGAGGPDVPKVPTAPAPRAKAEDKAVNSVSITITGATLKVVDGNTVLTGGGAMRST